MNSLFFYFKRVKFENYHLLFHKQEMTYHSGDEAIGKSIPIFFIFIILLFNLSSCEEEKPEPRTYPRVNTFPVINITENGATFRGEIYEAGTEPITECGFVWDSYSDPRYNTSDILGRYRYHTCQRQDFQGQGVCKN
jgi:hypothetical protein